MYYLRVVVSVGLDFSFGRPGGAAIVAAGYAFVLRYVPYLGDGGKGLTLAEVAEYRANGLSIGLVYESTAGRMFDGFPAGVADANQCLVSGAILHWPTDLPFYFACDVDTTPDQLGYVDDYLAGCASVLGLARVGVYGEYDVVKHCHLAGTATYLWQTYAWSNGLVYAYRHLYQYRNGQTLNGAEVDYNEAYGTESLWNLEDDEDMTPEAENFKIAVFCTNQEIRDLGEGLISRGTALSNADSRIRDMLAADAPLGIQDTLYSHVIAHPGGGGGGGLVPHHHESTVGSAVLD